MLKNINITLPFAALTFVGLCIFLTESPNGGAVSGSMFGNTSAHGLALSKNIFNSEHFLFMFSRKELADNKEVYEAYNRFPVFPFLLTGLVIYPFRNDITLQIYAARQLMNLFFFFSIILVFKIVYRLTENKYSALSVTLFVFSSYYMLSYNNMIFNDIPALFGFVTALYCVVTVQKKKHNKYEIFLYSLFPICLGWQPYAVFAAWFFLDALETFFLKEFSLKSKFKKILSSESFKITGCAILWGITILGLQLLNEWRIVGGNFSDIPSLGSGLWRSGLVSAAGHTQFIWSYEWLNFLPAQARTITQMSVPFWPIFQVDFGVNASIVLVISFISFLLFRYFKDRSAYKIHLILIISGLFWTIPMKHFVALHEFQSIFYIGFVISLFTVLSLTIKIKTWKFLAAEIVLFFIVTVALSNHYKSSSSYVTNQFVNINKLLPADSRIYFDGDPQQMKGFLNYTIDFYLSGYWFTSLENADYVVSGNPDFNAKKLTNNSDFNLYKND